MNKFQATLFSNESDIYTALHSNHSKMAEGTLRKIGFKRGLIYPKKLEREELIDRISDLPFSYTHIRDIQNKLAHKINQEQFSIKRIYENFKIDELHDVLNIVKVGRPKLLGNESIEHEAGIGFYDVKIHYTEFDFKRGKFQQKKLFGGDIRFVSYKDFVSVRYTYTPRIAEILLEIIKVYKKEVNSEIVVNEIDLSAITDNELRNTFMIQMYDFKGKYDKLKLEYAGLERVRVSRIKSDLLEKKVITVDDAATDISTKQDFFVSDDLDSELSDDSDDSDSLDLDTKADDKNNQTFNIFNASYDGTALVNAPQIKELCEKQFYRSHIRWKSKATFLKGNPLITFELGFDDKYFGRNIKFKILTKETEGVLNSKEKLSVAEFELIIIKLEEKIFLINDHITEMYADKYPHIEETQPEIEKKVVNL
jgi:hypothetical protein